MYPPVPVVVARHLDRLEHERQAGRREHRLDAHLVALEHANAPGEHVGRAGEELRPGVAAQALEIDDFQQHVAQRVLVERVELVGREEPRHRVEPQPQRRMVHVARAGRAIEPRGLQRRERRRLADPGPERPQRLAGALVAADRQAVGEHRGVHRAGARTDDALDGDTVFLEQPVEHPPGESAMRAAALEGEVDGLLRGHGLAPVTEAVAGAYIRLAGPSVPGVKAWRRLCDQLPSRSKGSPMCAGS
jgi:hypothetical protein